MIHLQPIVSIKDYSPTELSIIEQCLIGLIEANKALLQHNANQFPKNRDFFTIVSCY